MPSKDHPLPPSPSRTKTSWRGEARPLRILANTSNRWNASDAQACATPSCSSARRGCRRWPLGRYYEEARELARLLTLWSKRLPRRSSATSYAPAAAAASWRRPTGVPPRRVADHRTQHRPAARAAAQSLHHARAIVRVPLLLHAQAVVRPSGARAGGLSRWLRHARRAAGNPDPRADPQARATHPGDPLRHELTGRRSSISRPFSATA